jgi:hypothetical protein
MSLHLHDVARVVGRVLPWSVIRALVRRSVGHRRVSLCLHRVHRGARRRGEGLPAMSIDEAVLDALISELRATIGADALTVCFDDGYEDARQYVESRAHRFPDVEFLFFICPRKVERREGFVWDAEELGRGGSPPSLIGLGDHPEFRLATVEGCRALGRLGNVRLGNHTDSHALQTDLDADASSTEYLASRGTFERLFGPPEHLAIPFGTPGLEFHDDQVPLMRAGGDWLIWTTEPRPYETGERAPSAVLPRFAVDGRWTARELLGWIALRSLLYRVRGPRRVFPVPAPSAPSEARAA